MKILKVIAYSKQYNTTYIQNKDPIKLWFSATLMLECIPVKCYIKLTSS